MRIHLGPVEGEFTITLSSPAITSTTVSYAVTGSAIPGSDYTPLPGFVVFSSGATSAVEAVSVMFSGVLNGTETVILSLTSASDPSIVAGLQSVATVSIREPNSVTVIATQPNASEYGERLRPPCTRLHLCCTPSLLHSSRSIPPSVQVHWGPSTGSSRFS